jgi:flagellar hook-associated protein 2
MVATGITQPVTQINGLVTGLNTSQIITALLGSYQACIQLLQNQQQTFTQDQTAYKDIEAKLLGIQSSLAPLAAPQNNAFDGRTATSSDTSLLTAAASSGATPGVYSLTVSSLAQAQEIASQGFDSPNSAITQGTLQIQTASGGSTTITIDNTNNTLQGLANAINSSTAGVTASVVNDGGDPRTQPYRLLLAAKGAGTANAVTITNNLAADNGGARRVELSNSYINTPVTAADWSGTATVGDNAGASNYTGNSNNTYTFTVVNSGAVGTDNGLQLSYTDATGAHTGTITLNSGYAGVLKSVAQGLQIQLGAGTIVQGQTFTVDAFVPTVQQATNASVTLGSGPGALTVQSPTNQMSNVINGVTLNLLGANSSQPVQVTVANDTTTAAQDVQAFVDSYNAAMSAIDQQASYDPSSQQAGPLLSDFRVTELQDQLRQMVTNTVPGLPLQMNRLSALGITADDQGHLQVDTSKLNAALSGQVQGVSITDVRNLFALSGASTNDAIQFVAGSDKTQAPTSPVQVTISQAATRASITASSALASSTVINSANNTVSITTDGVTANITMAQGTYTQAALAQELQGDINNSNSLHGRQVNVAVNNSGQLVVTSESFGSVSQVTVGGANSALGFAGTEGAHGQDVAGKFTINGKDEPATGNGQLLTGNAGNANTDGLTVRSLLTSSEITSSPEASLTVSRGLASATNLFLSQYLDPITGRLQAIDSEYQQDSDQLQTQIDEQTQIMQEQQQALEQEFASMETTVAQLQSAGGFINGLISSNNSFNSIVSGINGSSNGTSGSTGTSSTGSISTSTPAVG